MKLGGQVRTLDLLTCGSLTATENIFKNKMCRCNNNVFYHTSSMKIYQFTDYSIFCSTNSNHSLEISNQIDSRHPGCRLGTIACSCSLHVFPSLPVFCLSVWCLHPLDWPTQKFGSHIGLFPLPCHRWSIMMPSKFGLVTGLENCSVICQKSLALWITVSHITWKMTWSIRRNFDESKFWGVANLVSSGTRTKKSLAHRI